MLFQPVAKAAMDTGVARIKINNFDIYKEQLKQRLDPTVTIMQGINNYIKRKLRKLFLQMGKTKICLKQRIAFKNSKLGIPP